jgi:hypothetical protein
MSQICHVRQQLLPFAALSNMDREPIRGGERYRVWGVLMKRLWAIIFLVAGVTGPAQAYTCADVRALSAEQQAYYIKIFNITPALQERIRQFCNGSGTHRTVTASEERMLKRLLHREHETRSAQ